MSQLNQLIMSTTDHDSSLDTDIVIESSPTELEILDDFLSDIDSVSSDIDSSPDDREDVFEELKRIVYDISLFIKKDQRQKQ